MGPPDERSAAQQSPLNRLLRTLGAASLVVLLSGCIFNRNDDSSVLEAEEQVKTLRCLDFDPADTSSKVATLPWISCAEEHSHEVFHVVKYGVPGDDEAPTGSSTTLVVPETYPGFAELESFAQSACVGEFETYFGINPFDSTLFYSWLVPTLSSWNDFGDYEIICVAGEGDGAPRTGSLKNAQR